MVPENERCPDFNFNGSDDNHDSASKLDPDHYLPTPKIPDSPMNLNPNKMLFDDDSIFSDLKKIEGRTSEMPSTISPQDEIKN